MTLMLRMQRTKWITLVGWITLAGLLTGLVGCGESGPKLEPVSGKVLEVNDDLPDSPEMLNEDPYGDGWIVKVEMAEADDINDLLTAAEYEEYTAEEQE